MHYTELLVDCGVPNTIKKLNTQLNLVYKIHYTELPVECGVPNVIKKLKTQLHLVQFGVEKCTALHSCQLALFRVLAAWARTEVSTLFGASRRGHETQAAVGYYPALPTP